jgi:pimeloyl-ACP methyl ester carboxylesterase
LRLLLLSFALMLSIAVVFAVVWLRAGRGPDQSDRPPSEPPVAGLMEKTSRSHPDQRFYLYLPKRYDGKTRLQLLVVVHGYLRRAKAYLRQFTDFADQHGYMILAPYYPPSQHFQQLGIGDDEGRADFQLLDLVDEVGRTYPVETATFDLFGFSAGAQFSHRFLYVHPDRLRAVVTASPGTITLPTDRYAWPSGIQDLPKLANVSFDLAAVKQGRLMLVVGKNDTGSENLNDSDEANRFGETRLERVRTLHEAWQDAGIDHTYLEIPRLSHVLDERIATPSQAFLAGD